jgi:serine/threonine protein kinase
MANTGNRDSLELNEESASTRQGTRFKSPITQELEGGEITLVELTCYGSAPEEHWTELAKDSQDEDFVMKEEIFSEVRLMDVRLSEKIAEGGQANVFFASCEKFSTPLVLKSLKYGQVDLLKLRRRMDKVMRLVTERSSAICRVMAVGKDNLGKVWILMERMGGDLRNLIDHGVRYVGYVGDGRMHYVKDGQMPFDYIDTIKMMMDIARGMEDLHSCGLIHRDLKAANILVTLLSLNPRHGEVIGLEQDLESLYFYVKVGDYESSDGIAGTGFWRPPEVLQALKDGTEPVWSCEGDVYSFAMLCYELLTGRIPFGEHRLSDYDVVLSGQRPELPAHVNSGMRNLLHFCWQTEPQKRPGWTAIIEYLKDEFQLHQPSVRNPRLYRRLKRIPEVERPSMESSTDIEDPCVGLSSTELLASSSMKFRPQIEDQSAGSSSTGLREMEGLGQGLIKCHGHKWDVISALGRFIPGRVPPKLVAPCQVETLDQASAQRASNLLNELFSIRADPQKVITFLEKLIAVLQKRVVGKLAAIWEEGGAKRVITFSKEQVQKTRATKVAVFWEASANRGITIATLLEELSEVPKKRKAMEAAIFSQTEKLIKAFQAAVKQDIALESSSPVDLATDKAELAYRNLASRGTRPTNVQLAFDVWRIENPVAFASWQEARRGESARKAASEAWQVAKETLKQVEKVLVEKLVFELKLDFLAGMLKHDSKGDMDNNWWDSEANMDDYCCKLQHSCQCPSWMQSIGAWRGERNLLSSRPENFEEMARIIEEATHTSPSLEIVLGGWKSVGQDRGLQNPGILQQLILIALVQDRITSDKLFFLFFIFFFFFCPATFYVLSVRFSFSIFLMTLFSTLFPLSCVLVLVLRLLVLWRKYVRRLRV